MEDNSKKKGSGGIILIIIILLLILLGIGYFIYLEINSSDDNKDNNLVDTTNYKYTMDVYKTVSNVLCNSKEINDICKTKAFTIKKGYKFNIVALYKKGSSTYIKVKNSSGKYGHVKTQSTMIVKNPIYAS